MRGILRNKNLTTRFEILVEVANSGPNVQQRDIARKLGISPQAVSDYIAQLTQEGMLIYEGRSSYKVTNQGVDWIIKGLRELSSYTTYVGKSITNISVCAAIAECDLVEGQKVGLRMKDGLLFATDQASEGVTGVTVCSAAKGEDVGVTGIEGIIPLQVGQVTILRVPHVQKGGSRRVDLSRLQREITGRQFIACVGIESLAALRKIGAEFHVYGAVEAAAEAAKSGLNPLVVCVEDEVSSLVKKLEDEKISYQLFDLEKN